MSRQLFIVNHPKVKIQLFFDRQSYVSDRTVNFSPSFESMSSVSDVELNVKSFDKNKL